MNLKKIIKDLFEFFNLDISIYPANKSIRNRMKIITQFNINLILDIGANIGQYALLNRRLGYHGRIISFEPMSKEYNLLKKRAISDSLWEIKNFGVGHKDTEAVINISKNSVSSSIHEMKPKHIEAAKNSEYISQENIIIKKVDSFINKYVSDVDNIFMKIDTQGNEYNVIRGANKSLNKISGIQMELSINPLYKNEKNHIELIKILSERGFTLFSIEPGFSENTTGQLLQYDGIFIRKNLINKSQ